MAQSNGSNGSVVFDEVQARSLAIVDETGQKRITLDARADGTAALYVLHPVEPSDPAQGAAYVSLVAGLDTEMPGSGMAEISLAEPNGQPGGSYAELDVAEMRLRSARVERLEKRIEELECAVRMSAVVLVSSFYEGQLISEEHSPARRALPMVEVTCPRCELLFETAELREHLAEHAVTAVPGPRAA